MLRIELTEKLWRFEFGPGSCLRMLHQYETIVHN